MEETTIMKEGDVTVTNARLIFAGQTYAMSGVTSVKMFEQKASKAPAIFAFLIGGGLLLSMSMGGFIFGALLCAAGYWLWKAAKNTYQVRLATSSGEATALSSKDRPWIERVVTAINDAIVARG